MSYRLPLVEETIVSILGPLILLFFTIFLPGVLLFTVVREIYKKVKRDSFSNRIDQNSRDAL